MADPFAQFRGKPQTPSTSTGSVSGSDPFSSLRTTKPKVETAETVAPQVPTQGAEFDLTSVERVPSKNIFQTFGRGFQSGSLGLASSVETGLSRLANLVGFDEMSRNMADKAQRDIELKKIYDQAYTQQFEGKFGDNYYKKDYIAQGVGSSLPYVFGSVAAGLAGGAGATAAGLSGLTAAGVSGLTSAAAMGLPTFGDAYSTAKEYGLSDQDADKVALKIAVTTAPLEFIGEFRFFKELVGAPVENAIRKSFVKNATEQFVKQGATEATTEATQQIVQNAWEKTYNENKDIFEGVGEGAYFGFLTGGLLGSTIPVGQKVFSNYENAKEVAMLEDQKRQANPTYVTPPELQSEIDRAFRLFNTYQEGMKVNELDFIDGNDSVEINTVQLSPDQFQAEAIITREGQSYKIPFGEDVFKTKEEAVRAIKDIIQPEDADLIDRAMFQKKEEPETKLFRLTPEDAEDTMRKAKIAGTKDQYGVHFFADEKSTQDQAFRDRFGTKVSEVSVKGKIANVGTKPDAELKDISKLPLNELVPKLKEMGYIGMNIGNEVIIFDEKTLKKEEPSFQKKEEAPTKTTFVGITSIAGRIDMKSDALLKEATQLYQEGKFDEAQKKYNESLKYGKGKLEKMFNSIGLKVKVKESFGVFGGQVEPNFDLQVEIPRGKEDAVHYLLSKMADQDFNQKSLLTYQFISDETGEAGYGIIDEERGISIEPGIRIDLDNPIGLQDVAKLDEMINEAGLFGASVRNGGKSIDILNISSYNNNYEEFTKQIKKFLKTLSENEISGDVTEGAIRVRYLAHPSEGIEQTYERFERSFLGKAEGYIKEKLKISTRVIEKIKNKQYVSRSEIENILNQPDITDADRKLTREVLGEFDMQKFSVNDFAMALQQKVLPVDVVEGTGYANYGLDNIEYDYSVGTDEQPKTLIFTVPIETGTKGHFGSELETENLFGHSRVAIQEEGGKKIGYIFEVQSDLFQKGVKKSPEQREIDMLDKKIKDADISIALANRELEMGDTLIKGMDPEQIKTKRDQIQREVDDFKKRREELVKIIGEKTEFDFQQQVEYYESNERYRDRIMNETLAWFKNKGVDTVRLATPSTAARIEWNTGGENGVPYEDRDGNPIRRDAEDLDMGDEITYLGEEHTVVDADRFNIIVAKSDDVRQFSLSQFQDEEMQNRLDEIKYELKGHPLISDEGATIEDIQKIQEEYSFNNDDIVVEKAKDFLEDKTDELEAQEELLIGQQRRLEIEEYRLKETIETGGRNIAEDHNVSIEDVDVDAQIRIRKENIEAISKKIPQIEQRIQELKDEIELSKIQPKKVTWNDIADAIVEDIEKDFDAEEFLRETYENVYIYRDNVYAVDGEVETLGQPDQYEGVDAEDLAKIDEDRDQAESLLSGTELTVTDNYRKIRNEYLSKLEKESDIPIEIVPDGNGVTWYEFPLGDVKNVAFQRMLDMTSVAETAGKAGIEYLEKTKKRLGLEFPTILVDKIFTGETQDGRPLEAYGFMFDNTIGLAEKIKRTTAQHELVHIVFRNLDRLSKESDVFRGIKKDKLYEEMRTKYGKMSDYDLEEKLASDFEQYVEDRNNAEKTSFTGKIKKFFESLYEGLKQIFSIESDVASEIDTFYKKLYEGKTKEEAIELESMTEIENAVIDGNIVFDENGNVAFSREDVKATREQLKSKYEFKIKEVKREAELRRLKENIIARLLRKKAIEIVKESLPMSERGKFMNRVAQAKTENDILKIANAVADRKADLDAEREITREESYRRSMIGFLRKIYDLDSKLIKDVKQDLGINLPLTNASRQQLDQVVAEIQKRIQYGQRKGYIRQGEDMSEGEMKVLAEEALLQKKTEKKKFVLKEKLQAFEDFRRNAIDVSSRIVKEISPKLWGRIRTHFADLKIQIADDFRRNQKLIDALNKLRKDNELDFMEFKVAWLNRKWDVMNQVAEKYGFTAELADVRSYFDQTFERGQAVDMKTRFLKDYTPRYIKEITRDKMEAAKRAFERALLRDATFEEASEIANKIVRGYTFDKIGLENKAFQKGRIIDQITEPELVNFFMDPQENLKMYINDFNTSYQAKRLFGKFADTKEFDNGFDDSIGAYVADLYDKGEITIEDQEKLIETLKSVFGSKKQSPFWTTVSGVTYGIALHNVVSSMVQLKDISQSLVRNGVIDTVRGFRRNVTMEDVGLAKDLASDIETGDASTVLKTLLKLTDLLDTLFGAISASGGLRSMVSQAKDGNKAFTERIKTLFGEERGQKILDELKTLDGSESGKDLSQDIRSAIYANIMADIRPTDRFEKTPYANKNPEFYTLKNFVMKFFDFFRSQGYDQIRSGIQKKEPKQVAAGIGLLTRFVMIQLLVGVSVDEVRNWIKTGKWGSLTDAMVDNLLQLVLLNKYAVDNASRNGVGSVILNSFFVPTAASILTQFVSDTWKDIKDVAEGNRDIQDVKMVSRLPFVGSIIYNRFGGGSDQAKRKYKIRAKYKRKN